MRNPLHSICPYFAMFPEGFARKHIESFTREGDSVFDPFSGRGTTLLEALLLKRHAIAMDINPVAYCISASKAQTPSLNLILTEVERLQKAYTKISRSGLDNECSELPPFFHRAFYHTTLRQILFLRRVLRWRTDPSHRFIATLVLGSLHGEMRSPSYFSNQMPRTISTKPRYSLGYWRRHSLWPRKRDVFGILNSRAEFRLKGDVPQKHGQVALHDAREASNIFKSMHKKITAVVTSPPYFNVTNYEEDQWLRLWFLGHKPRPTYREISKDDRHECKERYWQFLREVWTGIAPLLRNDAVIACRMGAIGLDEKEITAGLMDCVLAAFHNARLMDAPLASTVTKRQTDSFRPGSKGCAFELDYVISVGKI